MAAQKAASDDSKSIALPEVRMLVGGSQRSLRPARLLWEDPEPGTANLHGSLGLDFLNQAGRVTLDLRAMRITLAGEQLSTAASGEDVTCRIHGPMVCPKGWKCVLVPADDGCSLNRVPEKPWPGNSLPAGSDEGQRLKPGFQLREGDVANVEFHLEKRTGAAK